MTTMTRFEHTSVVLELEEKDFSAQRSDLLQGLAPKSVAQLDALSNDGWELVAVLPYISPSVRLMRQPGTDAALGFFKRAKA